MDKKKNFSNNDEYKQNSKKKRNFPNDNIRQLYIIYLIHVLQKYLIFLLKSAK